MAEEDTMTDDSRAKAEVVGQGGDAPAQILGRDEMRRALLGTGTPLWEVEAELDRYGL